MEHEYHFKLIDGRFTPEEAGRLLLDLIDSKIKFHSLEKFGIQIRYNGDISQSERRMVELRQMSQSISSLVKEAEESGKTMKINGKIEISLE